VEISDVEVKNSVSLRLFVYEWLSQSSSNGHATFEADAPLKLEVGLSQQRSYKST
jgi:hypothetical protein